jgi:mono/diheme cytochrome c family protein
MKSISILIATALILGLGAVALAAGDEQQQATASPTADLAEKGRAIYNVNCIHCHGLNMVNPGTVAYDLRQFPHQDKPRFVNSVTHGKNNQMPAWGDVLSPTEIDQVWAYVLTGGAR